MSDTTADPKTTSSPEILEGLKEFAHHLQTQDRSPVTIRGYLNDLRLFGRWAAAQNDHPFNFRNITTTDIQAYRQALLDSGARPQTINRRLAALAAYGHWAVQCGRAENNPAQNVRTVTSAGSLAPHWLDKRQRAALVRAVEKDVHMAKQRYPRLQVLRQRDATIVMTLLHTGLRVGELCALHLADIQLGERKGQLVVRSGKGMKQRAIPLNAQARQALSDWLKVRPEERTDALFTGQRGRPVDTHAAHRAVTRAAQAAGLSGVTPHTLRHSFAKALIDEGVSMEKVAALLGHSSLNTTRIYIAPAEGELEQAVGLLED